jgi:hypothetical protein
MGLVRKSTKPVSITDESGQPHLDLVIDGLRITTTPPIRPGAVPDPAPTPARPRVRARRPATDTTDTTDSADITDITDEG